MIAIIVSIVSLVVSVLAYLNTRRLKYKYTENGIIFYDKTGKKATIEGRTPK